MNKKSHKYPLLNNKEWLFEKYIEKELGTVAISKLVGAKAANSVRQALMRHSIPVRTIGDGLRAGKESDGFIINKPIIDGCLMGDGFLRKWNRESDNSFPYFSKTNKYYDHIKYVAKNLFGEKWRDRVGDSENKLFGKSFSYFRLRSLSNKGLNVFYERWYPKWNNYKKVIPEDMDISFQSLLNWFMDDGNSYRRRKESKTKQIIITLCTECFEKKNQQMLVDRINKEYGTICRVHPYSQGTGYRIIVPQSKADDFYNIIGECPVPSMEYKWK